MLKAALIKSETTFSKTLNPRYTGSLLYIHLCWLEIAQCLAYQGPACPHRLCMYTQSILYSAASAA